MPPFNFVRVHGTNFINAYDHIASTNCLSWGTKAIAHLKHDTQREQQETRPRCSRRLYLLCRGLGEQPEWQHAQTARASCSTAPQRVVRDNQQPGPWKHRQRLTTRGATQRLTTGGATQRLTTRGATQRLTTGGTTQRLTTRGATQRLTTGGATQTDHTGRHTETDHRGRHTY